MSPRADVQNHGIKISHVLVALNVGIYLLMLKVGGMGELTAFKEGTLCLFGANYGPLVVRDLQLHRLVTSTFIHMGPLHLLLNMWALLAVSRWVERPWGAWRFLGLYLVSGIAGSLASLALHWRSPVISAGASGAICGLIAGAAALAHRTGPSGHPLRNAMIRWALLTLGFGIWVHADNAAHGGGLIAGGLIGLAYGVPRPREERSGILEAIALLAVFGLAFGQAARLRARSEPASSLVNRAVDFAKSGHDDEAIPLYRRAIELEPKDATAYYDLGLALERAADWEGAEQALETALRLEELPEHRSAITALHVNYGVELAKAKRDDDAIAHYRRAIVLNPRDATARLDLALALERKDDRDGAEAELREAVAIDAKSDARAELLALLVHRGIEHAHAEQWDAAVADYRKALEVDPDSAAANFDLSLALERRGDHEAAWAAVEKSLAIHPTQRAQVHLAIVLDSLGRRRQAFEALAKARSMPPDD